MNKILSISDSVLFVFIMLVSLFGLALLYSATNQDVDIVIRQGSRLLFCFILMIIVSSIEINKLKQLTPYIYIICLIFLAITLFWGHDSKGAKRWIIVMGFSLQVSEILKITVPMMLAWYFSLSDDKDISLKKLIFSFLIIFAPIFFVIKQPDLGTSLIILLCGTITIFLGGIRKKYIAYLSGLLIVFMPVMWKFLLLSYQKQRIITMLDPASDPLGSGYHIMQSKIAVGSGGFFGKGFLNGTQSQLEFLPERGTDFIFAVFAEEFGFIGILILLLFYMVIIIRCMYVTSKAKNYFSKILSGSITAILILLIITNISMAVGVLPVVGVTLPLLSLGGSSLISIFLAFGIIFSVNRRN